MLEVDVSGLYTLSDEVIMHFDVLGSIVVYLVVGQVNVAHVVAIPENWILDGNTQNLLYYSFEPNGFTCIDRHTLVFSFCAR